MTNEEFEKIAFIKNRIENQKLFYMVVGEIQKNP